MSRAIVHKTKGKLDLRSITTFGLNAKPNSDTPIGYFGTGLKYALAVLLRENIPVKIYIDGKLWRVDKRPNEFRGKKFDSIYIANEKRFGLGKHIDLPFTTDLGKNWEIWQAFRELECNTRDEKGETYLERLYEPEYISEGHTLFVIEDERYVQEWLNRDKHFLKEGMTAQTGTDRIQVFPVKSNHIYYRGIRIHDLKEPSVNTYNFLCQIDLTEDRTAKSPYMLEYEIEQFLGSTTKEKQIISRAVTAPAQTYEHRLSYSYASKGETFLDVIESHGEDATPNTRTNLRDARPPQRPTVSFSVWQRALVDAIQRGDYDEVERVGRENSAELIQILERSAAEKEKEIINNAGGSCSDGMASRDQQETISETGEGNDTREAVDDDIPF